MKKLTAVLLLSLLIALLPAGPTFAYDVAIDEDFESGTLSGWTTSGNSVGFASGAAGANGNYYRVKASTGEANLIRSFSALSGKVTGELRVMTDATDKEKRIYFSNGTVSSTQKSFVYLRFTDTGKLVYVARDTSEVEVLSSVTPNQWYSIKAEMDTDSGKFDLYVDGVLLASQALRLSTNATEINFFNVKTRYGGALFVDDIKLYEPEMLPVLTTVPSFEAASYYISYPNEDWQVDMFYRQAGEPVWKAVYAPFFSAVDQQFRGSIVHLDENTAYEVKADIRDNGSLIHSLTSSFTTWTSDVPIAQTIPVSTLYSGSGQLLIDGLEGSADGWIKIVGDGTPIEGGTGADNAVWVKNSKYVILEKLEVRGGRLNGIAVDVSESVRVINNEVSGWGRAGTFDPVQGLYLDENGGPIDYDSGIAVSDSSKVVVERNYVHDPRGQTNSWNGPTWSSVHPRGPEGLYVKNGTGAGGVTFRYNDVIGSEDHRFNDGISGGRYNGSVNSGLAVDGDAYGNMVAFGNDDGIELDGGQKNVRFYNNKIEGFYSAISTAPDLRGPSYIFRNLIVNLGDSNNQAGSFIKAGGGDTYSKGREFVFHNTVFSRGQGINGIGYGSDANRKLFHATSRNNVIVNTRHLRDNAIKDELMLTTNDFDYDVLGTRAYTDGAARTVYSAGQEANGTFGLPVFKNIPNGDFRLETGSLGIDAGQEVANFTGSYAGSAPDAGAWELGASSLMPFRPIPLTADKYQVNLDGTTAQTVTVAIGQLDEENMPYRIRKNEANDWLTVSPASGTLSSNSTLTITVQADQTKFRRELEKGVVLVRLDNGYSLPFTVYADVTPPVTTAKLEGTRVNPTSVAVAVYSTDVQLSFLAENEGLSYIEYEYSLDSGTTWIPYTGKLTFANDGTYTVGYRARDLSGNEETAQTVTFTIDKP